MSAIDTDPQKSPENGKRPAHAVIAAFGGVRPMAHALGVAVSTVEGWKERGSIPRARHAEIAATAETAGVALDPATLAASDRMQAPTLEAAALEAAVEPPPETPPETPAEAPADDPVPGAPHAERRPPRWLARLAPQLPAAALGGVLVIAGFLLAVGTSDLWLGATAPGGNAGLQALDARVAALEQAPPPANDTLSSELARLQQDLAALRDQVQALPTGGDPAALDSLADRLRGEFGGRLDELAKSLADLKAAITLLPTPDPNLGAAVEALQQQQGALEQRLLALEATAGGLAARVGAVETAQAAALDAGPAALAVAAANLQDAVLNGRVYGAELEVVRGLAGDDAAYAEPLAALDPWAQAGVATPAVLAARFAELAPAIVRAGQAPAAEGDLLGEAWESIAGLVVVRPVGEVPGDDAPARVARAEARLAAGDLAAAVAELEGLGGAPAEVAAAWLGDAKARLAAAAAVERLSALALVGLGAASGSGG